MKIIYSIFLFIIITLFMLLKKSNKKQNVLLWLFLTLTILLAYNVLSSYILTLINLKSTLLNLTIFNILISCIMAFKLYKDKEIQKYYVKIIDIIFLVLLLILVIGIAYKQYGFPFKIKYETTDPGVHYEAAKNFYEQKVLLFKGEQTSYYGYETFMPIAYVNTGILMDLAPNSLNVVDLYQVYILFDLIMLYLMGAVFYFALINTQTSKISEKVVAIILSIVFIIGYPLNSMLFGFAYLSAGILMITGILLAARFVRNREMNIYITSIVLFFLMYRCILLILSICTSRIF